MRASNLHVSNGITLLPRRLPKEPKVTLRDEAVEIIMDGHSHTIFISGETAAIELPLVYRNSYKTANYVLHVTRKGAQLRTK